MLWVLDGEALWNRKIGKANKSCADCHNDASTSMKGVAARYPAFNEAANRPIDLEQRINICHTDQQNATPLLFESNEMLALAGFVGRQSRGMPIAVSDYERTKPFIEAGRAMFERRQGQLNLSWAQCHDDNWGAKLAAYQFRKDTPQDIHFIVLSGRRWALCSAGCAIASSVCVRRLTLSARRNMSIWSCSSCGVRAAWRSRPRRCDLNAAMLRISAQGRSLRELRCLRCVRSSLAGSSGRCNTSIKSFGWGCKSQSLTWSFVELRRATLLSWACEYTDRSVPFGKYCRSRPLVFSLEPRCHGLCGSQK